MFMPPAALIKDFTVENRRTALDSEGKQSASWDPTGEVIRGTLAKASERQRLRWKQLQHDISHSITAKHAPQAKAGERLVLNGRHFYISSVVNPMGLDLWTIYYCQERYDQ